MKVLFISRATLYSVRGGDTTQIENTAIELCKTGITVSIALCNNLNINYSSYDLIHFFNIIRPADIIHHIDKSRLPFVVSPIYVEYKEQARYNNRNIKNRLLSLLSKEGQEYVKGIARAVKNKEKIISRKYLLIGHKRSVKYILKRCSYLLPNSESEYKRLKNDFRCAGVYTVVPNGVDTEIFRIKLGELEKKKENSVLCMARFEPQKNQLNIVKALSGTHYQVKLVGNTAPNHQSYYDKCKNEAGQNIEFIGFSGKEEVVALYKQHKVHILPSWFETTGLSSLEAAACGCNIVISDKGDTVEYFGDHAFYCDPGNIESIRKAVDRAMAAAVNTEFMKEINEKYNWEVTARETLKVYQKVLGK